MTVDTSYDMGNDFHDPDARRRWPIIVFGILLVVVAVGALGAAWLKARIDPSGPPGDEIQVTIAKGQSTGAIGKVLEERGVVKSARIFSYYARFTGADDFKAGDFRFRHNEHLSDVIKTLESGPDVQADRITIPEGLTLAEIADKVGTLPGRSAERFLAAAKGGTIRSQF